MVLFERLIEEQKLYKKSCKTYIDDGDNETYSVVVNSLPYGGGGTDVFVNKEECHAHITKNIGTGLRTLVKNYVVWLTNFLCKLMVWFLCDSIRNLCNRENLWRERNITERL